MHNSHTTTTESPPLLKTFGLGYRKPNEENWLIHEITIELTAGSRLAVIGPTGSGKTLLLRALAWLYPIDAGWILWKGKPLLGHTVSHYRSQVTYLQQRPTMVEGTVLDNLRLPFRLRAHCDRDFSRPAIRAYLDQMNLDESILDRAAHELSGGEAQIVALLRAIQLEPDVLLLDEPTAALDDESTIRIEQLVTHWFEAFPTNRAYIWVSHSQKQVIRMADSVVTMKRGRIDTRATTTMPEQIL